MHDRLPGGIELTKGAILYAKILEDGDLDVEALAALRGKKHLGYDPEPIPEFFIQERLRQGGDPWP